MHWQCLQNFMFCKAFMRFFLEGESNRGNDVNFTSKLLQSGCSLATSGTQHPKILSSTLVSSASQTLGESVWLVSALFFCKLALIISFKSLIHEEEPLTKLGGGLLFITILLHSWSGGAHFTDNSLPLEQYRCCWRKKLPKISGREFFVAKLWILKLNSGEPGEKKNKLKIYFLPVNFRWLENRTHQQTGEAAMKRSKPAW